MEQLIYGKNRQLQFQSEKDLYVSIGFLEKANIRLYTENNDVNLSENTIPTNFITDFDYGISL